jgi:hypothetical protein
MVWLGRGGRVVSKRALGVSRNGARIDLFERCGGCQYEDGV